MNSHDLDIPQAALDRLSEDSKRHSEATISTSLERNNAHFKKACENIDRWADDMVIAAEEKLKLAKAEIRTLRTQMRQAPTLEEQRDAQKQIRDAERRKRKARNDIDDIEDEVEQKRESLILQLEQRLVQKTTSQELFTIQFQIT